MPPISHRAPSARVKLTCCLSVVPARSTSLSRRTAPGRDRGAQIGDDSPPARRPSRSAATASAAAAALRAQPSRPARSSFGDDVVGNKTDAQPVTLGEHRRRAAHHPTFHIDGADACRLLAGRRLPGQPDYLPAGGSCTIYVAFTPDSPGSKSATLADRRQRSRQPADGLADRERNPGRRRLGFAVVALVRRPARRHAQRRAGGDADEHGPGPGRDLVLPAHRRGRRRRSDRVRNVPSARMSSAGASCTIYVSFGPDSGGQKSANLVIGDNAPDSPQTVALSGNGISTPQVSLQPGQLSFGSVTLGTTTLGDADTARHRGRTAAHRQHRDHRRRGARVLRDEQLPGDAWRSARAARST